MKWLDELTLTVIIVISRWNNSVLNCFLKIQCFFFYNNLFLRILSRYCLVLGGLLSRVPFVYVRQTNSFNLIILILVVRNSKMFRDEDVGLMDFSSLQSLMSQTWPSILLVRVYFTFKISEQRALSTLWLAGSIKPNALSI